MSRQAPRATVPGPRTRGWVVALALAVTAGATPACARNPVTGERELALVSEAQEIQMGRESARQVEQSLGLVEDDALQQYVQRVGAKLAGESERPELPWTFRVVDDPSPNAFALPGGFIFVTRGMMNLMVNEAELASVLGHEIGHVTARHSVQQISRGQLAQLGLGLGAILAPEAAQQYGQLAGTGLQLLFLKYGRDDERQADELGFKYALNENYDVRHMANVFASLERLGEASGQSPVPSWMASHPDPGERVETARARVAALDRPLTNAIVDRGPYLARIDGLIYGENPRNGFFQGSTFIHPDLRFQLELPRGWRGQNLPEAVVAMSPEQDAILQLTLAQGTSPTAAARQFLSQQGVQAGQTFQQSINGIPAAGSYFQAQTEQGVVQGLAAFFTHGGNTYQLLSYAPAERFGAYDPTVRATIGSFRPLTDPKLLGVQPRRMDIVTLTRAQSLTALAASQKSSLSPAELAILNGVPTADTPLERGTAVKIVR
ncbi:MAG: M48 family metalloprotease [Gemmatimonadaceae bacterium]